MSSRTTTLLLGLILGLSGFASLVYEILWVRYFSYLLGGTVISLSIVSAVFLGGLAIGYRYLGRLGDRLAQPLKIYVGLEVGIALFSLLPLSIFSNLPALVDPVFLALSGSPVVLLAIQLLLVCVLVLPCTICMGGTVPVMLAAFRDAPTAIALARFYFINTLGGAAGTLSAVFLLLPQLGATNSHFLAVSLSLTSGVMAFFLVRHQPATERPPVHTAPSKIKLEPTLAALTFLCGFFILSSEILWSRLLMLYLGNTIFAFGVILGVVLVSIAAGSLIYPRLPQRLMQSWKFVTLLMLTMCFSVAMPALFYDRAAQLFLHTSLTAGDSWSLLILLQLLAVALIIGTPTFCSGIFFPLLAGMSKNAATCRSQVAGTIGFWNTGGTILGSLTAAFWILPGLGLQYGFLFLASATYIAGLVLCLVQITRQCRTSAARWGIPLILMAGLPWLLNSPWDQKMVHSGVYLYAPYYEEMGSLRKGLGQNRLLFSRHDRESSVSVNENRFGERSLVINGKVDASSGQDLATQYLLAHLPMLHHPNPEKVMIIGLGSGVTLGSAAIYPATQLDCLEISPAVVEASRFFNDFNRKALIDPRVNLKVNDGMYYLRTKGERYDVIISEPSNPWQRGNANLFSHDFYQQIRDRLNVGGIFCQWIPLYDLSPEHLKSALATFHTSFTDSMLFLNSGDLLVLGSTSQINKLTTGSSTLPAVVQQLRLININNSTDLYRDKFLYTGSMLKPALDGASINSLNHSSLEFASKPLFTSGLVGPYREANTRWLKSFQ